MKIDSVDQWIIQQQAPIKDWVKAFLIAKRAENLSKSTILFYEYRLNEFNRYCTAKGAVGLPDITTVLIREFLTYLEENKHNAGGIHSYFRSVKVFCRWYEDESEIETWSLGWTNPIKRVKPPRVPEELLAPASQEDIFKMMAVCGDNFTGRRDASLMLFLMDSGVRAAELLSLNLSDVSLSGDVTVRMGKGRKARVTYLGSKSRHALRAYLKMRQDKNPALWVTDEFERLSYHGLKMIMRRKAEKAGVPTPSIHSFRRWFCLTALANGMNIFSLQKLMGHSSLTVLRRYLNQSNEQVKADFLYASPVDKINA